MNRIRTTGLASLGRYGAALAIGLAIAASLHGIAKDVDFRVALLGQAFAADAGFAASVPAEVVQARPLLAAHPAPDVPLALAPGLVEDPLLEQRLGETLYPVRLHYAQRGRMLWMAPGPKRADCTVIGRSDSLVLADCR